MRWLEVLFAVGTCLVVGLLARILRTRRHNQWMWVFVVLALLSETAAWSAASAGLWATAGGWFLLASTFADGTVICSERRDRQLRPPVG